MLIYIHTQTYIYVDEKEIINLKASKEEYMGVLRERKEREDYVLMYLKE